MAAFKTKPKVLSRMNDRKIVCVVLVLCFVIPGVVSAEPLQTQTQGQDSGPRLVYINATSMYDYGWKVGGLFKTEYRLLMTVALGQTSHVKPHHHDTSLNAAQTSCLDEELQGLADRLGTTQSQLRLLQDDLLSSVGDCTVIEATAPATVNHTTYLAQNFDTKLGTIKDWFFSTFLSRFGSWLFFIVRINTMKYRYAAIGLPILSEIPLINEKGLCFGAPTTRFTTDPNRTKDFGPGIGTYELERLTIMTCANVNEAATLWENTNRACEPGASLQNKYDGSTPCFCDKAGGIVMIEQTHTHILAVYGNSTTLTNAPLGILWHANHHQWLDDNLTGSIYPHDCPSSMLRAERSHQLLLDNYGNVSLKTISKIMRDCKGGTSPHGDSNDICRRPDRNGSYITAFSWVLEPTTLTLYLAHGIPQTSVYWRRNFTSVFDPQNQ